MTALPFVRGGLGVAIVDGLLPWDQFPDIVSLPVRPKITVPIAFLTSKDRPLTGGTALMRDYLREACVSLGLGRRGN